MRLKKALLDLTSFLLAITPVLAIILAYYFTVQGLTSAAKEIGRLAAERVVVVTGTDCKVSVIRQS